MKKFITVFLLGIIISLITQIYYPQSNDWILNAFQSNVTLPSRENKLDAILNGLELAANYPKIRDFKCNQVAVGYNSNLDLIVKAKEVFDGLGISKEQIEYKDLAKINSLADLETVFGFFFPSGSAAERFVDPEAKEVDGRGVWSEILRVSNSLENKHFFTGGNAALMANRFAQEGCKEVFLGGAVGNRLTHLLDSAVFVPQHQEEDSVFNATVVKSNQEDDEIHLIMEYDRGTSWHQFTAPRANRFILQSDVTNANLKPLEPFHKTLRQKLQNGEKLDVVVISGLHLLDGKATDFRQEKVDRVAHYLSSHDDLSLDVPVHLELASIGELNYMRQLVTTLLPRVDSLGLNEQELGSVYFSFGGKEETRASFANPKVRTVVDALHFIFEHVDNKIKENRRVLTRIHFHCLSFHLIATRPAYNAADNSFDTRWQNGSIAVTSGSLAATKQACDNPNVQTDAVELHVPLVIGKGKHNNEDIEIDVKKAALTWQEKGIEFSFAPVLVCKKPTKTVGLGDAISTVGLLNHLPFERRK